MPRFNQKRPSDYEALESRPDATVNHEGGLAFTVTPEMELVRRCCANMLGEPKFYEPTGQEDLKVIQSLSEKTDTDFLLSLANYVRNKMQLRTSAVLLYVLAAMRGAEHVTANHRSNVRSYGPKVLVRADEPAEAISAWLALHGGEKQWSRAFIKGVADALATFDEYALAKHDHNGAAVKLRDVIQIVHPKPVDEERAALYKRALEGKLATPETWETKLSAAGKFEGSKKKDAWDDIAPKMGLFALVRNLRNFEQAKAEAAIQIAVKALRNEKIVRKSRMLPFRFMEADQHVSLQSVKNALRDAVDLSVANLPKWPGKTAVFVDLSGSMTFHVSSKSQMTNRRIAALMGAMALHMSEDAYVMGFGDTTRHIPLSKRDSILTNADKIERTNVGCSTNAYLSFEHILDRKLAFQRVLVFTDEQTYDSACLYSQKAMAPTWRQYARAMQNFRPVLFNVNLAAYGMSQMPKDEPNVVHLSGWSEGILEFVSQFGDAKALVDLIREKW